MNRFLNCMVAGSLAGGLMVGTAGAQNSVPLTVTSPVAIPVVSVVAPKLPPEPTGLADIVKAKFPLAVVYKDFGLGWRELNWQGTPVFTKGETHWLSGKEFLICYKLALRETRQLSEKDYAAYLTSNTFPFSPEERFELTLLPALAIINDVTNGNTGLRSFDPTRHRVVFDSAKGSPAFNQSLSVIFLQKIFDSLNAYRQAYLDTTPPTETAFAARQALQPLAENNAIFTVPGTDQPFKVNPLFSQRKMPHLRGRGKAVLFYEGTPAADGLRAVLLLNGTVRRVSEKVWDELKKKSELD